ncbi:hypothetical protein PVAP13_1NG484519 [Panicum virgatum]|uniref:Uncharacterized protein n=1 Tax=Panicum virgatum TaxID=38727 RepID=A0A8T0X6Z2_PANVG|nr:hypothetical protein PVAP13_1NG484519 [Panicum virgatum]
MPAPEEPSLPALLYSLQEHILGTFQHVLSSDLSYKDGRL